MYRLFQYVFLVILLNSVGLTQEFTLKKVTSGLSIPWGMAFIDKQKMIITQRDGKIYLLDTVSKKLNKVNHNMEIYVNRQGGLLDVQVSPNYQKDQWIYFTYVKELYGWGVTVLSRGKLINNKITALEELLVTRSASSSGAHFGSRITFDGKGHLYFGVGDRGERPNGQDINTHAGTIMKLYLDGGVPQRNPFYAKEGLKEIYSYGHRNPQGLFFDKKRDVLFECEHGPRGGDEINIIKRGKNYGWSIVSKGKEYWNNSYVGTARSYKGMVDPLYVYTPSIAPSSLMVYSGKVFKKWEGDLFLGALALRHINKISLDNNLKVLKEQRLFEDLDERIRNIIEAPDGTIYFSTDSGFIYQITL